ncbi:flagellar protein [Neorhizobium sp. P12A]|uniref:flagellar protein n=1 Tax=Neorhizobium sp. P12A TaxID=2268027 RepID=UPI0011ED195B|nr:flagellar protein [Neorhizobium sp. P12A]KAA0699503.1 flagellar protein [Neorhizobium sp. P12A]
MTDSDADVPVAPLKGAARKSALSDKLLKGTGLVLAALSAFFPWYVFFNPDKFGIHATQDDRTRILPDWPARNVFSVSPLAMVNKNDTTPQTTLPDQINTATITDIGKDDPKGQPPEDQPFPGKSSFHLLHVANGRALIQDGSGMYLVRVGSILPDNSRLATIEQRNGKWVIVTSKGEIYAHD